MALKIKQTQVEQPKAEVKTTSISSLSPGKAVSTSSMAELSADQAAQVVELVELKLKLEAMKPLSAKSETLRKQLLSFVDQQFDKDEKVTLVADKSHVVFSPCSKSKQIKDMNGLIGALKAKIGYEALIGLLKLNLTDIQQYLSEAEMSEFIEETKGSRTLKDVFVED